MANLQEGMNFLDERLTGFGPENWRDSLSSAQTASVRLRSDLEELRRALGYADIPEPETPGEHS